MLWVCVVQVMGIVGVMVVRSSTVIHGEFLCFFFFCCFVFFFLMIRRPPRSPPLYSSAASNVYKGQARWKKKK